MKNLIIMFLLLISSSVLYACGDDEYYEVFYLDDSSEVVMICAKEPISETIEIKSVEDNSTKRSTNCNKIKYIYIENDWKSKVMYLGAAGASVGALGVVAIPAGAVVGGIIGWGIWIVNEINSESLKADFCVSKSS